MKSWRVGLLASLLLFGCTKANPRSCLDANCTDPAFPYCDTDGSLAGEEKTCIAVDCTPGEVVQCQGNNALTCNEGGGDYDLVQCDLGCDLAIGGCRLCEPNQTACTNGKVATCDAAGRPTVAESCALGCFESEPRCREIAPSNGLASLIDTPNPPDVSLVDATINTAAGTITTSTGPVIIPTTTSDNGRLRVFITRDLVIRDVTISSNDDPFGRTGPAVAFVARGKITIEGRLRVLGGAGGIKSADCRGGNGVFREDRDSPTITFSQSIGSGGGGNATPGARGGNYGTTYPGGAGGGTSGTEALRCAEAAPPATSRT